MVLTNNEPSMEDRKVTETMTTVKVSYVYRISHFILYSLLLNCIQVESLPAPVGIFIKKMRCQNLKACPGRESSLSGFIATAFTNGGL